MEQIRAFIAIELPEDLKGKLAALIDRLRQDSPPGTKWVNPNGIHLTLKFLGNIPASTTEAITQAIRESAEGIKPCVISTSNLGAFPNPKRAQVAWIGLSGELDHLKTLQKRLESNLAPLGFAPETRPFTPHLTLARVNKMASSMERQRLGEQVMKADFAATKIKISTVSLMKSQLSRTGAIYSRISSVSLG